MKMNLAIARLLEGALSAAYLTDAQLDGWGVPEAKRADVRRYLKTWIVDKIRIALRLAQATPERRPVSTD